MLEGRYALCVLFEYAATMGVIDVAYADPAARATITARLWGADQYPWLSRYDGLVAVRVNELGAAILHNPRPCRVGLPVPRLGPSVSHAEALPAVLRLLGLVDEGLGVVRARDVRVPFGAARRTQPQPAPPCHNVSGSET